MKYSLARIALPQIELLPLYERVAEMIGAALRSARSVHLASTATQILVDGLVERLGLPGPHIGSKPNREVNDANKAILLTAMFGKGGYDYVSSPQADPRSWESTREVVAIHHAASQRPETKGSVAPRLGDQGGVPGA